MKSHCFVKSNIFMTEYYKTGVGHNCGSASVYTFFKIKPNILCLSHFTRMKCSRTNFSCLLQSSDQPLRPHTLYVPGGGATLNFLSDDVYDIECDDIVVTTSSSMFHHQQSSPSVSMTAASPPTITTSSPVSTLSGRKLIHPDNELVEQFHASGTVAMEVSRGYINNCCYGNK